MKKMHKPVVMFYKDKAAEWRWKVIARNGRIIADSAEGYKQLNKCRLGFELTQLATEEVYCG